MSTDRLRPERGNIWNCSASFENVCPREWADLSVTEDQDVRYCSVCDETVTLCTSPTEFVQLGNKGQCVACPDSQTPESQGGALLGRPSLEALRRMEQQTRERKAWWEAALAANPQFAASEFADIRQRMARPQEALRLPRSLDELRKQFELIATDPEAAYLEMRIRPSGKREGLRLLFKLFKRIHPETRYPEFKRMAARLDREHPVTE